VVADRDALSPEAQARLAAFVQERDGFALAEADLRQRGPGEFFGTRQAGLDGFQVGDLAVDLRVLDEAREAAAAVLRDSPDLEGPWLATRRAMESRWTRHLNLARVG
jgi:ATP-dependent DNA helicase RecG